jgi:hypothetical protein
MKPWDTRDDAVVLDTSAPTSSPFGSATTVSTTAPQPTTTPSTATSSSADPSQPSAVEPPSTTDPPAPIEPATLDGLDIDLILAFAQAHHDTNVVGPYWANETPHCPEDFPRASDAGDDTTRDIETLYLTRYCDGRIRLIMQTGDDWSPLKAFWMELDVQPGGCAGTDRVVVGWERPAGQSIEWIGDVLAIGDCDPASCRWLDTASTPLLNPGSIVLVASGEALGTGSSFEWRGYVLAMNDDATDAVPNGGPDHFVTT